jgi:hypothetical protein
MPKKFLSATRAMPSALVREIIAISNPATASANRSGGGLNPKTIKAAYSLDSPEREFQIQPARNPAMPPTIAADSILTCPDSTRVPMIPPRTIPMTVNEIILLFFIISFSQQTEMNCQLF